MYYLTGLPGWARFGYPGRADFGYPGYAGAYAPPAADEKELLKNQAKFMEGQLAQIKERLDELEKDA